MKNYRLLNLMTILLLSACQPVANGTRGENLTHTPSTLIAEEPIKIPTNMFSSLTPAKVSQPEVSINGCISPVVTLGFPVGKEIVNYSPEQLTINPPSPWIFISDVPSSERIKSMVLSPDNKIWITLLEDKPDRTYKYEINSRKWEVYETIGETLGDAGTLKISPDGTVWGITSFYYKPNAPWLSRFNLKTNKFEFVADDDDMLQKYSPNLLTNAVIDNNGILWMILSLGKQNSLVSFNPANNKAKKIIDASEDSNFSGIEISPNNNVWLLENGKVNQLIMFDPNTGELQSHIGNLNLTLDDFSNENLLDSKFLYFDRLGNLWVDDRGWFNFQQKPLIWNKVIRSPIFITDWASPENQYMWIRPDSMYQSSDGTYWFQSSRGTVHLDPEKGNWCLLTNSSSPVIEDSQHNLWMVAFGKLYKLPLVP